MKSKAYIWKHRQTTPSLSCVPSKLKVTQGKASLDQFAGCTEIDVVCTIATMLCGGLYVVVLSFN